MKKIMFVCDTCEKENVKEEYEGYPYDDNWVYLYELVGKVKKHNDFKHRDKYFCSFKCLSKWIERTFKEHTRLNLPVIKATQNDG